MQAQRNPLNVPPRRFQGLSSATTEDVIATSSDPFAHAVIKHALSDRQPVPPDDRTQVMLPSSNTNWALKQLIFLSPFYTHDQFEV